MGPWNPPLSSSVTCSPYDPTSEESLVEGFVGLTVSADEGSLEVSTLLDVRAAPAEGRAAASLERLLHACAAVTCSEPADLLAPLQLIPTGKIVLLKNSLTKELLARGGEAPPEPLDPSCRPAASAEARFVASEMADPVPNCQLLVNEGLEPADLGAVGVTLRKEVRK